MSAVNSGPQIIKNGLVLDLDSGNRKSYTPNRFQSLGTGLITENVTFALQGTGTFQRIANGTIIGGYKVKPNDVVYSYVLGVNGCHYHGNTTPIPSGVYATFSFDYLVTGATNYPSTNYLANFENYGGGALGGSVAAPNSSQDIWQRLTFTSGPTTSSGTQAMFLYPGACGSTRLADSGTLYYKNPKVEFTNVDTGNSTFSSTSNISLWYDLSGNKYNATLVNSPLFTTNNAGIMNWSSNSTQYATVNMNSTLRVSNITQEVWVNLSNITNTQVFIGCQYGTSTDNSFALWFSGGSFYFGVNTGGTFYYTSSSSASVGVWYHLVHTYNGGTQYLYINGVLASTYNSSASGNITYNTSNTLLAIAGDWNGPGYDSGMNVTLDGKMPIVRIYNRALSAAEVLQNYQATRKRFGV